MNPEFEIVFAQELPVVVLGEFEVATLSREDWPRAARLLEEEHYLGDTRPVGRTMSGPAEPFAQLIRGHWGGCEIRNHGTRDVQWEEDKTRSGNWALNANVAILRVALLSVKFRQSVTLCWPRIFEQCAHSSVSAMSLIN